MGTDLSAGQAMAIIGLILTLLLLPAGGAAAADPALYPPVTGTDREAPAYLTATERFLRELDLSDETLTFERLGGTTRTNWVVRRHGEPLANLKCSAGNTNHHGAVVTYRLGQALGFNIYPVAVYREVDRSIDGRRLREQCALKEWASVFTQYYWTRSTFDRTDSTDKRRLTAALDCAEPAPTADEVFTYTARSAYGHPKIEGMRRVPYRGPTNLLDAARDFSSMMVIDVLIGNEDRFPGGNMFFRSTSTAAQVEGGQVLFRNARLFSLDNEAGFKGATPEGTYAARDLSRHVSRFDRALIDALPAALDDGTVAELADDPAREAFLRRGIELVLARVTEAKSRCGADAVFF